METPVNGNRGQALVIVLLLGVVLAWMLFDAMGDRNPLRDVTLRVVAPVQYALERLVRPVVRVADGARSIAEVEAELVAAKEEIAELRSQIVELQEAKIENETLRKELGFKIAATEGRIMAAEVIGQDTSGFLHYLIIDRGAEDGLRPDMPVLTSQGLVGRVTETNVNSAKVMLIVDPSSSVSGRIQRSRATGMVQGYADGALIMRFIPKEASVEPGDVVLTSGLGGNFPKRLPIGQVISVQQSDVDMFQVAYLSPAVDLHSLEMVSILMGFEPVEGWPEEDGAS